MSYWEDRMANAQTKITNKNIRQIEKQMKNYYSKAMESTIASFIDTYNKVLEQVTDGEQVTPALLYKLDTYWQMQGQLRRELEKLGEKQISALTKVFELNFFDIYYSISFQGMEAFNTINSEMVQQLINHIWVADGKNWSQRIWDNTELLASTLNEELVSCVVTGKKTSELKKKLQERFNVSYSRADALARTELAHIQTQAAKKRYEDYGIKKVEFWADPDERTCPKCGKLHKKIYSVYEAVPLPLHPRCRCTLIPVIE